MENKSRIVEVVLEVDLDGTTKIIHKDCEYRKACLEIPVPGTTTPKKECEYYRGMVPMSHVLKSSAYCRYPED